MTQRRRGREWRKGERNFDRYSEIQRRLLKKTGWSTVLFFMAGLAVAVTGAALVAWLLTSQGVPFLTAWVACMAVLILPALAAALWNLFRGG